MPKNVPRHTAPTIRQPAYGAPGMHLGVGDRCRACLPREDETPNMPDNINKTFRVMGCFVLPDPWKLKVFWEAEDAVFR